MTDEPSGNPHVYNAIKAIGEANHPSLAWENGDTERIASQIEANTRATLALAYEQRTANGFLERIAAALEGGHD